MSRSPERISSYRRHFEDISSSSSYQVRVSSPSPTLRVNRHQSANYSPSAGASRMQAQTMGRRTVSTSRNARMAGGNVGTMACVGYGNGAPVDLDASAAENKEFLSTRSGERQEMVVLNDRLAVYIEKVRSLEQQNKLLEMEIDGIQNRFVKPSGLRKLYEDQLRDLKRIADQMRRQRDQALAGKEAMAGQLEITKVKYEEAVELRRRVEMEIEAFRPDVDRATSQRIALEKQLEQLEVEIEFLQRVHKEEIEELLKMIYAAHSSAQSAYDLPDLSGALKQIQAQYDEIAAKNLQEMDSWYKSKFEDLNNKTTKHVDMVRSVREEVSGAKKDILNKERGLEALKTKNEALEAQVREAQEKYKKELEDLQARIEALKEELKSTKSKIALHLREYQDLLNMKMALEIEITTYRKLIEGEDLRLTTMVGTMSIMSSSSGSMSTGMSVGMARGIGPGGSDGGMGGAGGLGGGMGAGGMGAGSHGPGGRVGAGIMGGGGMGAGGIGAKGVGAGGVGARGLGAGSTGAGGMGGGMDGGGIGAIGNGAKGMGAGAMGPGGNGGGMGNGAGEYGYGASMEYSHEDQAVEMTERRTVLIRTVKSEDETLESDTTEQTYIISGAADDSDEE
ncbi:glial fibrillary acidic protein-like isoform X1 [Oncorhynchus keta]|uniref:glial fibrillary acidic protein-like isoform X1 n=1 Tax=Oncorhynchus keta TaxID=8018 RepID=UPI0015FC0BD5|nr:glial fibrillary acidic protein-like isoform X1 [Oncorhynchus keta]